MHTLFIFLQHTTDVLLENDSPVIQEESYFDLLLKGGWILVPIFLLSLLSVYVIINKTLILRKRGGSDQVWFSRIWELVNEHKTEKAIKMALESPTSSAKVLAAGIREAEHGIPQAEEAMEAEARQQVAQLEEQMNYLGITAAIAPMLGFLGTIFGVIRIFYNISLTNDLNIASISDGLYQKMICSGVGLLVGIIAYTGYYVLQGYIDKIVIRMERDSNEILKAFRAAENTPS